MILAAISAYSILSWDPSNVEEEGRNEKDDDTGGNGNATGGNRTYSIVAAYPHDTNAFTQGLVYHNGTLYEGTGLLGRSSLREVEMETGKVLRKHDLDDEHFGEGITLFDGRIYQLTWQSRIGFVYDEKDFRPISNFTYDTEGWGLTHDGERLIMSDGTPVLYFLDPETLNVTGTINVSYEGKRLYQINELEYVNGSIYANVWQTDRIAIISPEDGNVTGWIDLAGIRGEDTSGDVLNGIAYDAEGDRLFVTGKLWSKLYEIDLVPAD